MFLRFKASFFIITFCFFFTCSLVSADDIPTMLWNIKGNSMPIKPISALGHNDKVLNENLKNILHLDSRILVFAVNKLSLEDFYAIDKPAVKNNTLHNVELFLDSQPHMLLPSVKDPLSYIHKAHCGVQEIVVDNKIDETVMQAVSKAMQRSCVVILHVSDEGIVAEEGKLQNVFMPPFENSNKNVIGIFTGVKSSWSGSDGEHHIFRNLLQSETSNSDNFVNITGCIIMYAENATITVGKENTTSLPFPVVTDGSSCDNVSLLQLNFKTSGLLSSVTLKLNFTKSRGAWKTEGTVSMTGDKALTGELNLDSKLVGAPLGFSYSCGTLVLDVKNENGTVEAKIVMESFQVQPYDVGKAFNDSFDCTPYFTIPIWMGVFISILFIVILNIGIYALFSVHTMDRFDDPKGKTISVGAAAD